MFCFFLRKSKEFEFNVSNKIHSLSQRNEKSPLLNLHISLYFINFEICQFNTAVVAMNNFLHGIFFIFWSKSSTNFLSVYISCIMRKQTSLVQCIYISTSHTVFYKHKIAWELAYHRQGISIGIEDWVKVMKQHFLSFLIPIFKYEPLKAQHKHIETALKTRYDIWWMR